MMHSMGLPNEFYCTSFLYKSNINGEIVSTIAYHKKIKCLKFFFLDIRYEIILEIKKL